MKFLISQGQAIRSVFGRSRVTHFMVVLLSLSVQGKPGDRGGGDEPHRQLRGQRSRHRLRDRQPLLVLLIREAAALLDEVAAHVAGQRDRAAEPGRAQPQEVEKEAAHRPRLRSCELGLLRARDAAHAGSRPLNSARLRYSYNPSNSGPDSASNSSSSRTID